MHQHEGTEDVKHTKALSLALSYDAIGAAIEVHRLLGPGLLESVYEAALCRELSLRCMEFHRQKRVPVSYKGMPLECEFRIDLLIGKSIIVEVKAVERILPVYKAQLLSYLRLHNLWLGLLINFNVEVLRDGIRRVLNG
jgi:GxxExxY protein